MADSKIAMSRALGAAFLNHQVEQLEKSVNSHTGASSKNWRDRKFDRDRDRTPSSNGVGSFPAKRQTNSSPSKGPYGNKKKGGEATNQRMTAREGPKVGDQGQRRRMSDEMEKDADVVVVDASVLVHAVNHLKKWCRNGREEVIIVPLEALNTLDLLKKGTTSLAQRARTASRILEAQVGTNPRIRVQRDEAFVLWDNIKFGEVEASDDKCATGSSPEWVRRTICCAQWEVDNAAPPTGSKLKVALAVCTTANASPQSPTTKLPVEEEPALLTPVPLPAPSHHAHANKHEPRTNGSQVASWASKAGIPIIDVKPAPPQSYSPNNSGHPRSSSEEDRPKRIISNKSGGRRPPTSEGDKLKGGLVERSPAVLAMMEMVKRPDSKAVRVLARGEKLDPDT